MKISNFNSQPLCTVGLKPQIIMHLSILINGIFSYTKFAGLEIPVDSAVARWTLKNGNAGPKLHWRLWEKRTFPALPGGLDF